MKASNVFQMSFLSVCVCVCLCMSSLFLVCWQQEGNFTRDTLNTPDSKRHAKAPLFPPPALRLGIWSVHPIPLRSISRSRRHHTSSLHSHAYPQSLTASYCCIRLRKSTSWAQTLYKHQKPSDLWDTAAIKHPAVPLPPKQPDPKYSRAWKRAVYLSIAFCSIPFNSLAIASKFHK